MRDLTHRILFLAGTTLLAAAVIYGAPSTPASPEGAAGAPVRMASAAALPAIAAPLHIAIKGKSARHTDTVKPNGASCPGANAAPAADASGQATVPNSSASPPVPNGKVASPCPPNASDARTDIARGHALATPEPLNSKQLIAPTAKTPG